MGVTETQQTSLFLFPETGGGRDMSSNRRGFFVVIEGIDGSGKSTGVNAAVDFFRSRVGVENVTQTKEPGGTAIGQAIRAIVLPHEPDSPLGSKNAADGVVDLLFLAAHQQNWVKRVQPALLDGHAVVSDRWYYSQMVYQMEREVPSPVKMVYSEMTVEHRADLLIVFTGDSKVFLERATRREGEKHQQNKAWSDLEKLSRIQNNYFTLFHELPETVFLSTQGKNELQVALEVVEILEGRTATWLSQR